MHTNYTNNTNKNLIYPRLSYVLTGLCFKVHNKLGRFAREKQYCDFIQTELERLRINFIREYAVPKTGNRFDFLIDDKMILEVKAKRILTKDDYYQIQRYLQCLDKRLGLLVNFRNQFLKPIRIIKIETDQRKRFV